MSRCITQAWLRPGRTAAAAGAARAGIPGQPCGRTGRTVRRRGMLDFPAQPPTGPAACRGCRCRCLARVTAGARAEHLQLGDPVPVTDGSQALLIDVNAWNDHHDPRLTPEHSDACVTTVDAYAWSRWPCTVRAGVAWRGGGLAAAGGCVDVSLWCNGLRGAGRADAGRF